MTSAPVAAKARHPITLTRAALYLLEGCLQHPGPCTTNPKVVQWAKVWDKVRKANDRMIKVPWEKLGHDFEKPIFRNEGESDADFAKRSALWNERVKEWEDEVITVTMNDKMRDTCRETVEWIHAHRDDPKNGVKFAGKHASSLLVGLGVCKPESDDDYEMLLGDVPAAAAEPEQPVMAAGAAQ